MHVANRTVSKKSPATSVSRQSKRSQKEKYQIDKVIQINKKDKRKCKSPDNPVSIQMPT